jgi:hypothetical protein
MPAGMLGLVGLIPRATRTLRVKGIHRPAFQRAHWSVSRRLQAGMALSTRDVKIQGDARQRTRSLHDGVWDTGSCSASQFPAKHPGSVSPTEHQGE